MLVTDGRCSSQFNATGGMVFPVSFETTSNAWTMVKSRSFSNGMKSMLPRPLDSGAGLSRRMFPKGRRLPADSKRWCPRLDRGLAASVPVRIRDSRASSTTGVPRSGPSHDARTRRATSSGASRRDSSMRCRRRRGALPRQRRSRPKLWKTHRHRQTLLCQRLRPEL